MVPAVLNNKMIWQKISFSSLPYIPAFRAKISPFSQEPKSFAMVGSEGIPLEIQNALV
jgi:hypothetical protein